MITSGVQISFSHSSLGDTSWQVEEIQIYNEIRIMRENSTRFKELEFVNEIRISDARLTKFKIDSMIFSMTSISIKNVFI